MKKYIKIKHKLEKSTDFDGAETTDAPRSGAYLTRINKSTSLSVKFEDISFKVDDILCSSHQFIKSLRYWIIDNSKGVVYE